MDFTYNAEEAYEASSVNFELWLEKDKEYINSKIEEATLKGEFSIIYDNRHLKNCKYAKEIKKSLNDLGYKIIEKIISEERKIWIISWEDSQPASQEPQPEEPTDPEEPQPENPTDPEEPLNPENPGEDSGNENE